jgi:hypothetical protein
MKQESIEYFVAFTEAEIRIDRFFLARKRHWLKMQQFVSRDMLEPPPKNWTEIRRQILYRQINGEWEYQTQTRERNKRLQKFLEEQRAISEERNRLAQQARSIRLEKQILREADARNERLGVQVDGECLIYFWETETRYRWLYSKPVEKAAA